MDFAPGLSRSKTIMQLRQQHIRWPGENITAVPAVLTSGVSLHVNGQGTEAPTMSCC